MPSWIKVGVMLAVIGAGAVIYVRRHRPVEVVAPVAAEPVAEAPTAPEPLFGGQTETWWWSQLSQLRTHKDELGKRRYALSLARARAAGLEVDDSGDKVRVSVPDGLKKRLVASVAP